jgi:hypothetical protein
MATGAHCHGPIREKFVAPSAESHWTEPTSFRHVSATRTAHVHLVRSARTVIVKGIGPKWVGQRAA